MGTLEVLIRLFSFRKKMNKYNFEWLITILYDLFQYHIKSCSKIVVFIEWSEWVKVTQWCSTLGDPMDYTIHGILQARILEWVAFPFSRAPSQPWDLPRSPALQVDSLPAEPLRKPKNTGVSNLSLLQWIFPTQELNQGLLKCRWILYQLSYQGSPVVYTGPH